MNLISLHPHAFQFTHYCQPLCLYLLHFPLNLSYLEDKPLVIVFNAMLWHNIVIIEFAFNIIIIPKREIITVIAISLELRLMFFLQ